MKTIETIIEEYKWHYPFDELSIRKMLLEAQICALEGLRETRIGQCIGNNLEPVIADSEVSERIIILKTKLEEL